MNNQTNPNEIQSILKIQIQHWIAISLEIAEITSKVMDWKIKNPSFKE
jgi:hypothetical protein